MRGIATKTGPRGRAGGGPVDRHADVEDGDPVNRGVCEVGLRVRAARGAAGREAGGGGGGGRRRRLVRCVGCVLFETHEWPSLHESGTLRKSGRLAQERPLSRARAIEGRADRRAAGRGGMRISELSAATALPTCTIKYYLREGLLPAGHRSSRTTADYDATHMERLRLVRALIETGGLGLAAVRRVLTVIDAPDPQRLDGAGHRPGRPDGRRGSGADGGGRRRR